MIINPYAYAVGVGSPPLDGLANLTGAWSFSRDLLTSWGGAARYTEATSKIDALKDQSGSIRDFLQTTAARRPVIGSGGLNNRLCGVFNSTDVTYLTTAAGDPLSDFITASAGYMIVSFIPTTIDTNQTNVWLNEAIISDVSGFMGLFLKTGPAIHTYNWDGNSDSNSTPVVPGLVYVAEWRHDSGNVYVRINGGTEVSAPSGDTTGLLGSLRMGNGQGGNANNSLDGKIFEAAIFSAVPASGVRDTLAANFLAWVGGYEAAASEERTLLAGFPTVVMVDRGEAAQTLSIPSMMFDIS